MTTTARHLLSLSNLGIAALVAAASCGGKPAEAPASPVASASSSEAPSAPASAAVAPASAPGASTAEPPPAASSAPAPLATVIATDPTTIQKLFDDAHASSAALKAKGAAADDPIAKGLRDVAKKVAPDMEADGPLATGKLKEKQGLQTEVTLAPGKCYTIVGYSKKVKDLDLYLLLAPGIPVRPGHDRRQRAGHRRCPPAHVPRRDDAGDVQTRDRLRPGGRRSRRSALFQEQVTTGNRPRRAAEESA